MALGFAAALGCNADGQLAAPTSPSSGGVTSSATAGPLPGSAPSRSGTGTASGLSLSVSPVEAQAAEGVFALNKVLDLTVHIYGKGVQSGQTMTVQYRGPDGRVFARHQLPVGAEQAQQLNQGQPLTDLLPIGGTLITSHGLAGRWTVEASVPGGSSISAPFTLAP